MARTYPMAMTGILSPLLSLLLLWNSSLAEDKPVDDKPIAFKIEPPFAWNRTDRYEPANYEAFFPKDDEAGKQVDLWLEGKLIVESVDERLALVRRGLRTMRHHRTTLLGSLGNQFIWNKKEQDPRAIELMYHASASDDDGGHHALYHGPTVVAQRTPNLVRMLMERYFSFDVEIQKRIPWGMTTYGDKEITRKLLLDLLNEHKKLDDTTVAAAIEVYQAIFETTPPEMDRFDNVGQWVIAFHRDDVSASHPQAAQILRKTADQLLRGREERLIDFVTRVDGGHETAVLLVQGLGTRNQLMTTLATWVRCKVDLTELFLPRTLQGNRLREFASHLPKGLPKRARPSYTRPPAGEVYAYCASAFVAPNFKEFFADDAEAGRKLDHAYKNSEEMELSDRELLDLFRRGVRRSEQTPNLMFGWISTALGWPRDPMVTEILYQAMDPAAPPKVRNAAIYYGFGLGTSKTMNVLEGLFRAYMAPPFDRVTNYNTRSRILWGVRDHEDDKYYLVTRFEETLRRHAELSDEALIQADFAYRELTREEPPNAADYAARGVFVVLFEHEGVRSKEALHDLISVGLGDSKHLIGTEVVEHDGHVMIAAMVRGTVGKNWLLDQLQTTPHMNLFVADLLTRDLIEMADKGMLKGLERFLPASK